MKMTIVLKLLLIILFLNSCSRCLNETKELIFVTDKWAPYVTAINKKDNTGGGIVTKIITKIVKDMG